MTICQHEGKTRTKKTEYEAYVLYEVFCAICGMMIDSWTVRK